MRLWHTNVFLKNACLYFIIISSYWLASSENPKSFQNSRQVVRNSHDSNGISLNTVDWTPVKFNFHGEGHVNFDHASSSFHYLMVRTVLYLFGMIIWKMLFKHIHLLSSKLVVPSLKQKCALARPLSVVSSCSLHIIPYNFWNLIFKHLLFTRKWRSFFRVLYLGLDSLCHSVTGSLCYSVTPSLPSC